jgi:hypothetical protein
MIFLRKILITTDMSEFSLAAMEYAASLGLLYASRPGACTGRDEAIRSGG